MSNANHTLFGTAGGTLLSVSIMIDPGDIVKTAILAMVGAGVSFVVTFLLRRLVQLLKRK
jgi:uncharacterized membrane protein YgaE (UPF0421/DUF939 family)